MTQSTPTTAERPTGEHVLTRVLAAPRELVFDCLVQPEHLAQFWGPTGTSTPIDGITVDARPGGVFETTMVSDGDGSRHTMRAVFDQVERPRLLAWTEPGSGATTTCTFVELDPARTEVTIHRRHLPPWFLTPEATTGFASSQDRFAAYLEQLTGDGR